MMDDPNARADLDEQAAAAERAEGKQLYGMGENLETTAENLRQMGWGDAAAPLERTADVAYHAGLVDMQQSDLLKDAAKHWRETADDLEQQSKASGASFVAHASHDAATDLLAHAGSETEKTEYSVMAATSAAQQTTLEHRAAELGQEAQHDASTAIADEVKARGLDH
jgi:hypothetical protein